MQIKAKVYSLPIPLAIVFVTGHRTDFNGAQGTVHAHKRHGQSGTKVNRFFCIKC